MRAFWIVLSLIALVIGTAAFSSDYAGTEVTTALRPVTRTSAFGDLSGSPKPHGGAVRLAAGQVNTTTGNPSLPPFKWVGFLNNPTATKGSPNGWACTAQFITPNVVMTAGHCLRDLQETPNGPWPDPSTMAFWLQFQNNEISQAFKIVCGKTNPLWELPANYASLTKAQQNAAMNTAFQHDYAMLLVNGTSPTGSMPYALDWKGKVNYAVRVGYPDDILNAAIVQQDGGYVFFSTDIPMGPDSLPNIVVQWGPITNFTHGSSGGAWIANFDLSNGANSNILIAVTSFDSTLFPGAIFASYLTAAEFNPLLNSVQNGCK